VGGRAFRTIEAVPWDFIECDRLKVPVKRRPGKASVEMVLRVVAQNMPELSDKRRFGDCDETHSQISARLHGLVSTAQVAAALGVLDDSVFVITRRPAKDRHGTHRTFHPELAYNIAKWERSGAEPTPQEVARWDERLYGLGYKPHHSGIEAQRSGVRPASPIEVPITNTNITPIGVGRLQGSATQISDGTSLLSKEELQAEIDRQEEIARSTSNPSVKQQAWRRFSDLTAVLHAM
jgi:hypothetical protein